MAAEAGHHASRSYQDQADGAHHVNGAPFWDDNEVDISDKLNALGAGYLPTTYAAATAAGTVQANATQLAAAFSKVTCDTTNKGVILANYTAAQVLHGVRNLSETNDLKIYPPSSNTIDGGSASVAITLGATTSCLLVQNGTDYARII